MQLTKVIVEHDQRDDVDDEWGEDGQDHEVVPGADRQPDHEQLSEDEGGEGDGHHVDELRLKQQQGPVHDDAAWNKTRATIM